MKYILPLALLLALAVPVGAEQEKYGCAITPEGRACLFSDRQIAQMDRDQYCLATMEAAMRAMDPWVAKLADGSMVAYEHGRVDGITATDQRDMKRLVARFIVATSALHEQWDAAKACWREKP